MVKYFAIVVLLLVCGEVSAQKMKERSCVRKGNKYFNTGEYKKSIAHYEEALQHDPNSFEAKFDLGSALYCNERYEEAEKTLLPLLDNESLSEIERGEVAYNLGNTQFAQKKYKEALASYRTAMRCNPNDKDAKFNYAYTKLKLQQQEQQQQQDNQNQDQNQDQNKDQNKDQQNNQNQNQQGQDKDQNQDQNQDQNKDQQNDQNKDKNDQQDKNNNEDKQDNKQDKNNNEDKQDNKQDDKQNNDKEKEQPNDNNQGGQQPQNQNGKNNPQQGDNPQPSGVTPEQEAMLQAIQAEEDKTQDKLDKEKAGVLIFKGKNW